ncbi:TetR/AcrR family transcriptional regulator [Streptomyces sp. NPDC001868]|uniref:TetR/AcrR family transcriptional regulator n=1 Tax=Streptomyces sp. NPDC001868 TaxID=3154401 RepID=UPI00332EB4C4
MNRAPTRTTPRPRRRDGHAPSEPHTAASFPQQEGPVSSPMPPTAGMPRDALHQEQIMQAAITLLDEGGFESLSMRRLGSRLGITAAALYRHIKSRHDLLLLAADTVWGQTPLPALDGLERRPASPGGTPSKPPRGSSRSRSAPPSQPPLPRTCPSDCSRFSTASKPGLPPVPDPTQQKRQTLSSTAFL